MGGTTLYAAWNKEWDFEKAKQLKENREGKHRLYALIMERFKVAEEFALKKAYEGVDIEAIAWVQGVNDAGRELAAKSYKNNLKKFIMNLRQDLPDSNFKFVYLQVNNKGRFIMDLRDAQKEPADEMDNVFMVASSITHIPKDFPKYDDVHYNGTGVINIGKALAREVCNL